MQKSAPIVQQQRDPLLDAVRQQAEQDRIAASTDLARRKTDDLLIRFGQRSALANAGVTPLAVA